MDNTDKITAEIKTKVKDPKRVEAGKKLAALSKAARERKKVIAGSSPTEGVWDYKYSLIGVISVTVAMASLLIAYKTYSKKHEKPPTVNVPPEKNSNIERNNLEAQ